MTSPDLLTAVSSLGNPIPGYTLFAPIGTGAMGQVFAGTHDASGRAVAVKLLLAERTSASDLARFEREARAMRSVSHPNVCTALDFGVVGERTLFLVMERLVGEDLGVILARAGTFAVDAAIWLAIEVARGLCALHDVGLLHRDLKPSNLFLHETDWAPPIADTVTREKLEHRTCKVVDFGLATFVTSDARGVTRTGEILGTPAYMSLEQARGGHLDARADVFGLGAVLYHVLTGAPPRTGATAMDVLMHMVSEPIAPVRSRRHDVPEALAELIDRMLAVKPEGRPAHMRQVLGELELIDQLAAASDDETMAGRVMLPHLPDALVEERRLVTIVAASGVIDAAAAIALLRRHGGLAFPGEGGRVFGLFGANDVLGDEIEHAVEAAHALGPLARRVDIGAGRARGRDGHVSGNLAALADAFTVVGRPGGGDVVVPSASPTPAALLPFVGREVEVGELISRVGYVFENEQPGGVVLDGPPGVGKSRVMAEVIDRLRERHPGLVVLAARGDSNHRFSSWRCIAAAIRDHLELAESSPAAQVLSATEAVARSLSLEPGADLFLAAALGASSDTVRSPAYLEATRDPKLMRDQIIGTLGDLLEALALKAKTVVVIDDVHWVDGPTLDVIDAVLRRPDVPLFVLFAMRAAIGGDAGRVLKAPALVVRSLGDLSLRESERLVAAAFERRGVVTKPELVHALVETAGGNPFFITAICDHVAEARARFGDDALDPTAFALPFTVEGAIQSRLDALPAADKDLLKRVSVFGMRFWEQALGSLGCLEPAASLPRLSEAGLIARPGRRQVRLAPYGEYQYRQRVVREVAYAMLTEPQRRGLHRLAARWLETVESVPAEEVAQHLTDGGDLVRAAPLWSEAAARAVREGDLRAAWRRLDAALDGTHDRPARLRLWLRRLVVLFDLQLPALVVETLDAIEGAGVALEPNEAADVAFYRGRMLAMRGQYAEADARLCAAEAHHRSVGDGAALARTLAARALAALYGRLGDPRALAEAAIAAAPQGSSVRAVAFGALTHTFLRAGALADARDAALEATSAALSCGDLFRLQSSRGDLAYVAGRLGRYDEARATLETVIADTRRVGQVGTEGYAWHNLGLVRLHVGDADGAVAAEARALELGHQCGDQRLVTYCRIYQARIHVARGELEAAGALLGDLLPSAPPTLAGDLHTLVATAQVAEARFEVALVSVLEAQRLAAAGAVVELLAERDLAHVAALEGLGRHHEAEAIRAEARAALLERAERATPAGPLREGFLTGIAAHRALLGDS